LHATVIGQEQSFPKYLPMSADNYCGAVGRSGDCKPSRKYRH
jgi:hypothetical protein